MKKVVWNILVPLYIIVALVSLIAWKGAALVSLVTTGSLGRGLVDIFWLLGLTFTVALLLSYAKFITDDLMRDEPRTLATFKMYWKVGLSSKRIRNTYLVALSFVLALLAGWLLSRDSFFVFLAIAFSVFLSLGIAAIAQPSAGKRILKVQ